MSKVFEEPFVTPPAWPQYDDTEREALLRVLDRGQWWRGDGGEVQAFEEELAQFHNAPAALAVTNGTHAIELALMTEGVGKSDEVLVPAFTFISTAIAVQRIGATPIPVDVELDTYNIAHDAARAALTDRTRAVIPVHMAGQMVDLPALDAALASRGPVVIQDAAHAHGARWDGRALGEFGSTAILSFQAYKLMTAGEGGALLFADHARRERAERIHNCGRSLNATDYSHELSGSNFRMSEFSGALLRCQLRRLREHTMQRETNAALLRQRLGHLPGLHLPARREACEIHPHYMFMFRLESEFSDSSRRDGFVRSARERGIPAQVAYPPVYRCGAFWPAGESEGREDYWASICPNAEQIGKEGVWIHHRVLLGATGEVDRLAEAIASILLRM